MCQIEDDDFEDYSGDDDYEEDPFEAALQDCSMMEDGLCGQAGSEYCEFECTIRKMWDRGDFDDDDNLLSDADEELPW